MPIVTQKPTHQQSTRRGVIVVHVLCGIALLSALLISHYRLGLNLINQPVETTCILWAVQGPVVSVAYSLIRASPQVCSAWRSMGRGLLSIPAGALVNAFGAIVFGAPLGLQAAARTLHWSLLMSSFTVVPVSTVFGMSWPDWQRVFAHFKLLGAVDYALCFPAYGAVIGAWFGAWPMPLDWERPWQEWPICVTYGTVGGYLLGLIVSGIASILNWRWLSGKGD
uniref:GPI biosynthesis protein Pig-F n=1 Tax=Araucaria cunninghamii TaxID=56994 RepID=A0A0D6R5Q8_ARACU